MAIVWVYVRDAADKNFCSDIFNYRFNAFCNLFNKELEKPFKNHSDVKRCNRCKEQQIKGLKE